MHWEAQLVGRRSDVSRGLRLRLVANWAFRHLLVENWACLHLVVYPQQGEHLHRGAYHLHWVVNLESLHPWEENWVCLHLEEVD